MTTQQTLTLLRSIVHQLPNLPLTTDDVRQLQKIDQDIGVIIQENGQ